MPMSAHPLPSHLSHLLLGGYRYLPTTTSTNNEALAWVQQGASDCSVIIADAQTQGRGRLERRWLTTPSASLAFSLILKPTPQELPHITRFTALAALALVEVLSSQFSLSSQVKWPNDVLIQDKKVAGILVENHWQADDLQAVVIGMGVNIAPASVPAPSDLRHPAACLEHFTPAPVDRFQLLADLLQALITLREQIGTDHFLQKWNDALAYRGQRITVHAPSKPARTVTLLGIVPDGALSVLSPDGQPQTLLAGEVSLTLPA